MRLNGKTRLPLIALAFLALGGLSLAAQDFPVEFSQLSEGVWLHRSYALYNGVKTPSNGLLVATKQGLLLIDTAWTPGETEQILAYAKEKLGREIKLCIITHSHADRAGGLAALLAAKIPVRMHALTRQLLGQAAESSLVSDAANGPVTLDGLDFDIQYFGPAHTVDNITVWFPATRLLFGGCMVKSLDASNLGNIADASLDTWPSVMRSLIKNYSGATLVIPGHGQPGNFELVHRTLALAEAGAH